VTSRSATVEPQGTCLARKERPKDTQARPTQPDCTCAGTPGPRAVRVPRPLSAASPVAPVPVAKAAAG